MLKRKKYSGLAAGFLCAMLASISVFAAEPSAVAKIPAEQRFESQNGQEAESTFHYVLEAENAESPMPEGSEDGSYSFFMTGTQKLYLDGITYTSPGIYRYEAYQIADESREGYQYDSSRYTVDVYVKNAADGGLEAEIVIWDEKGEKCESITFVNRFKANTGTDQSGTDLAKTGDDTEVDLWLSVIAISGMCAVILIIYPLILPMVKRRKVNNED